MSQPPDPDIPDISDEDVLEAMRAIPGYLDISVEDFRALYVQAREHALERALAHVRAGNLMHVPVHPLASGDMLDRAARQMVAQRLKALPVADAAGQVVGILTESDFLRRLQADSFLELMLRLMEDPQGFGHRCHETPVSAAMSSPAVSVSEDAGFSAIAKAFRACPGGSLPVVDANGLLRGLLLRKHFVEACHLEPLT